MNRSEEKNDIVYVHGACQRQEACVCLDRGEKEYLSDWYCGIPALQVDSLIRDLKQAEVEDRSLRKPLLSSA